MFTKHISRRLAAQIDGELSAAELRDVELHLEQCPRCRAERDEISLGMQSLEHLPAVTAPDSIWIALEAALREQRSRQESPAGWWRPSLAAAAAVLLIVAACWIVTRPSAGPWIETDSVTRLKIAVGAIGSIEVAPNTRLRLLKDQPNEHRFELARGTIQATITAPPRLFFVNTPAGTAVDLGCEYTLNVDEKGVGMLRVTRGWVAYEWKGLESLVPAGAMCRTRPETGPGVPYFEDAPESLRQAVESTGDLNVILATSRARDTLTLWHLLWRVDAADRGRVYDRMAALVPVPAGVSRDRALALDPATLKHWKEELAWTW